MYICVDLTCDVINLEKIQMSHTKCSQVVPFYDDNVVIADEDETAEIGTIK